MQEVKKSHDQDLRADPTWSRPWEIESNPGDFPGSRQLRVVASSLGMKGTEMLSPSGVRTFHRSNTFLLTSLVDSQSPVLSTTFFLSCEMLEFAKIGHGQRSVWTRQYVYGWCSMPCSLSTKNR